jgi:hypothetical protein
MFFKNGQSQNGQPVPTSYSWRDSKIVCVMDCFYSDISESIRKTAKAQALDWQAVNDLEGIGPHGKFSKDDRRVFWGSYGEFDLSKAWKYYYDEGNEKYDRLRALKAQFDPDGIFNPNTFGITPQKGFQREADMAKNLRLEHESRLSAPPAAVAMSTSSSSVPPPPAAGEKRAASQGSERDDFTGGKGNKKPRFGGK